MISVSSNNNHDKATNATIDVVWNKAQEGSLWICKAFHIEGEGTRPLYKPTPHIRFAHLLAPKSFLPGAEIRVLFFTSLPSLIMLSLLSALPHVFSPFLYSPFPELSHWEGFQEFAFVLQL